MDMKKETGMTQGAGLRAEKISRNYFRKGNGTNFFTAVKETDLILAPGTLTEIVGRSGSGKSTLLNMMAGLLEPTGGKIRLGDIDLYALDDEARSRVRNERIGVIPQGQTGLHSLTVLENVMLPYLLYYGAGEKKAGRTAAGTAAEAAAGTGGAPSNTEEAKTRALELLERVGLLHLKDVWPNELSGGEMRRLSIARALLMKPEILLADEPTGDLDDDNTRTVLRLLRECADQGTAVLLVTHERDAAPYADTIYRMSDGVLAPGDRDA